MQKINSQAFKVAHQIKNFFQSWSQALRAGWIIAKMYLGRKVHFEFVKESTGEVREADAIAAGSLLTIGKGFVRFVELIDNTHSQWRSFKIQNLVF